MQNAGLRVTLHAASVGLGRFMATTQANTQEKVRKTRAWWLSQPSASFLRNPYFYFLYDGTWTILLLGVIALCLTTGWKGFAPGYWALIAFPAAVYIQIMCGVFVHNAVHENFPRPINRLMGELTGFMVGSRYASWEILHRYHHMYSDHETLDPHPVNGGFWHFFFSKMLGNLEPNLRHQYLERWGDTKENRRAATIGAVFRFCVGILYFVTWFVVLGPFAFFAVFFPAFVLGLLHVSHFNWATHDGDKQKGDYRPINLDHGVFWIGNRILFGLYYHGNHHAYVKAFNPMKLDPKLAARVEEKISSQRVRLGLPE